MEIKHTPSLYVKELKAINYGLNHDGLRMFVMQSLQVNILTYRTDRYSWKLRFLAYEPFLWSKTEVPKSTGKKKLVGSCEAEDVGKRRDEKVLSPCG